MDFCTSLSYIEYLPFRWDYFSPATLQTCFPAKIMPKIYPIALHNLYTRHILYFMKDQKALNGHYLKHTQEKRLVVLFEMRQRLSQSQTETVSSQRVTKLKGWLPANLYTKECFIRHKEHKQLLVGNQIGNLRRFSIDLNLNRI